MKERIELPQGTLDLLILRTLALEPQHGRGISERVQQMSSDVLRIQIGEQLGEPFHVHALYSMERNDCGPQNH